jgi:hypothetical protein
MSSVAVVDSGLWQHPSPETALPITLERIIAPRPLVAKSAWIVLPDLYGEAGYDFVAGDLVAPYGKGTLPDVVFHWEPVAKLTEKRRSWDMVFPTAGSGIVAHLVSSNNEITRSALDWNRTAPDGNYSPSLRQAETTAGFGERGSGADKALYYFRSSREGGLRYGVILDGEPDIIFYANDPHPVIKLTYAIGSLDDRSLEPDPNAHHISENQRTRRASEVARLHRLENQLLEFGQKNSRGAPIGVQFGAFCIDFGGFG